jgi:hypothetical protein
MAATHKPPTLVLVFVGVCSLMIAPMFLCACDAFRQVTGSDGKPIFRPDGRPLLERDWLGQLNMDWPGYTLLAIGSFFLVWSAFRGARSLYESPANDL